MISNFYKDKNLCFSIYSGAPYLEGEGLRVRYARI